MAIGSDRVSIGNDRVTIGSGQFLSGLISQGSGVSSCVLRKSLAAKKSPDGHTKVRDRVDFVCASCVHRDIRECIVYQSGVIVSAPLLRRVFIGDELKFTLPMGTRRKHEGYTNLPDGNAMATDGHTNS